MQFQEASRKNVRLKAALAGKSGAGKTWGSLTLAKGLMGGKLEHVGVLQTEPGRAEAYLKDFPGFKVLNLEPPFSPDRFVEAIEAAQKAGLKVLIIDSLSDEWAGPGGCLQMKDEASAMMKNSYTAWNKVTPKHDRLFQTIVSSPLHIICTMKKKTQYVLEKNSKGKEVPKRVGLKDIQRDDSEYRWLLQLDLENEGHLATVVKDNTGLFDGKEPFLITEDAGGAIRDWCLS